MLMGKFTQQGQCRSPYKPNNENIRTLKILWSAAQSSEIRFYKCISLMSQMLIHPNNLITKTDHLFNFLFRNPPDTDTFQQYLRPGFPVIEIPKHLHPTLIQGYKGWFWKSVYLTLPILLMTHFLHLTLNIYHFQRSI